jgi:exopolyphosphatase/guanosine-5'-triphosphate,3'-diphosphate pyrophosphatase
VRVAVVDIGTNSTRVLITDVTPDGGFGDLHRESIVTRLGDKVDSTGRLSEPAMQRVFDALKHFRELIDEHEVRATIGVLTSAVRDAANGPEFTADIRAIYGIDARTISGDEEAALTFAGATSERPHDGEPLVVVDIGGGSTEFVIGRDGAVDFHVSTQAGVVRQTERHLEHDPPRQAGIDALREEFAQIVDGNVPREARAAVRQGIAVAGTATSCASIELGLEPYDPKQVHGHVLTRATVEGILERLAPLTNDQRRDVKGLHPDRAPTIVAGVAMLLEVFRAFDLDRIQASEHDILRGAALKLAARSADGSS